MSQRKRAPRSVPLADISTASIRQLTAMPAAVLRLHLANHHLITTGTKATMARRLFDAIHGTSSAITTTTTSSVTSSAVIATSASATTLTSVPPLSLSTQQTATPGGFTPAQMATILHLVSQTLHQNPPAPMPHSLNTASQSSISSPPLIPISASSSAPPIFSTAQLNPVVTLPTTLTTSVTHIPPELWLDNMASHTGSSLPNTRWPCTYCGSMYHFPDRCPRCPFRTVKFNDGDTFQRDNGPRLSTCRDFNNSTCHRNLCHYQHRCQYCGSSSHPAYRCGRPPTSR